MCGESGPVQVRTRQKAGDFNKFLQRQGPARAAVVLDLPMNDDVEESHPDRRQRQAGSSRPSGVQQRFRRQQVMAPTQVPVHLDGERNHRVPIRRMMEIHLEALRGACERVAHALQQARRGIELPRIDQHVEVDHLPPRGAILRILEEPGTALERTGLELDAARSSWDPEGIGLSLG